MILKKINRARSWSKWWFWTLRRKQNCFCWWWMCDLDLSPCQQVRWISKSPSVLGVLVENHLQPVPVFARSSLIFPGRPAWNISDPTEKMGSCCAFAWPSAAGALFRLHFGGSKKLMPTLGHPGGSVEGRLNPKLVEDHLPCLSNPKTANDVCVFPCFPQMTRFHPMMGWNGQPHPGCSSCYHQATPEKCGPKKWLFKTPHVQNHLGHYGQPWITLQVQDIWLVAG